MSNRVIPAGSINPNAQLAPGVLVLESLTSGGIAGVNTNSIGVVGTATWGPVAARSNVSNNSEYKQKYGGIEPYTVPNAYNDMGTFVASGLLQGNNANYACVRVTDGTDVMASSALLDVNATTGVLLTAIYSGTTGNTLQATISPGAVANSYKVTIGRPGYVAEIYANIDASQGASSFWNNVISAINNGISGQRGPSQLVVASLANGVNLVTMTNNGTGYSSASATLTGGGGTGATASAVLGFAISSVAITVPGSYATIPAVSATLGSGATLVPSMGALTAATATAQSSTGSYAPGNTITLAGGTFSQAAALTVATTKVVSATVVGTGTGGTAGTQTVTGTTGTGTKFQASVTIFGGSIAAILSITVQGSYSVNPTVLTAEPVTGGGLTGATLSVKMGVDTTTISTPGSYTVLPSNPVAQGSTSGTGTGFTATISTWKVATIAVPTGGGNYTSSSVLTFTGGGSTGGAAGTLALAATGTVKSIVIITSGDDYISAPTVVISGDGTGAAATASIGSNALPNVATPPNPFLFAGGTNGNTGVTNAMLIGQNANSPTGMYVLQNSGVSLFSLVGNDDSTTFIEQDSFAGQIGAQAIVVGSPGEDLEDGISAKTGTGISDNSVIYMLGNWCYFLDNNNNGTTRLISPQGYYAGKMGNISPEQSPLNKPIYVMATQRSYQELPFSDQDIIDLQENGMETIDTPSSGGVYFSAQTGRSAGYDPTTNLANIQRMANFIGSSIGKSGVIGGFIGQLQTPEIRLKAKNAIVSFLQNLISNNQIKSQEVILDETNNPDSRVELGFMQARVQVQLFSVIIVFIIDLDVGTTTISAITPV